MKYLVFISGMLLGLFDIFAYIFYNEKVPSSAIFIIMGIVSFILCCWACNMHDDDMHDDDTLDVVIESESSNQDANNQS